MQYSKVGSMNLSTSTKKHETHNFVAKKEIPTFNPKTPPILSKFKSVFKKLPSLVKKKEISNRKNLKSPSKYSKMKDDISRLKLENKKISSKDLILNLNSSPKKVSINV